MKAVFACVAENREDWFERVHALVLSIRRFGGSLAEAPIRTCFVEGADDRLSGPLRDLGAEVNVVPRVHPSYPYANKLRMLELPSSDEVLIALDCDVVVLGDISAYPDPAAVLAKPADCDFLTREQWGRVFRELRLDPPENGVITTTFGRRSPPYFNSGVVLVPGPMAAGLRDAWEAHVYALQPLYDRDPGLARHRFYTDQIALTCALVAERATVRTLPVSMNFPTHLNVHPSFLDEAFPPLVVHYHKRIDAQGWLLPTRYPEANRAIDELNRARAEALSLPYAGMPAFTIVDGIKQGLRSKPWFHAPPVKSLRRAARRLVPASGR